MNGFCGIFNQVAVTNGNFFLKEWSSSFSSTNEADNILIIRKSEMFSQRSTKYSFSDQNAIYRTEKSPEHVTGISNKWVN